MTILKVLYLRDGIESYESRKDREKERLSSIEDCVYAIIQKREQYTKKSQDRLITAAGNSSININTLRTNRKTTKSRKQKWKEKQLYA